MTIRIPTSVLIVMIALASALLGAGIGAYGAWQDGYNSGTADTLRFERELDRIVAVNE